MYSSEIWSGQTQGPEVTSDWFLGVGADFWEEMANEIGAQQTYDLTGDFGSTAHFPSANEFDA